MKRILIIGAGFLQTYVIKKAKELGYYVLVIDGNPSAPGFAFADEYAVINITDEEACLLYAKENKINGVLTAATDYGVLSVARISNELGLKGISYNSAKRIKNKYQVRKCLYEAGADDTGFSYEVTDKENIVELAKLLKFPVMVKPCDGSGSRGTSRVDSITNLMGACEFAISQSFSHKAIVEPFINGMEYGVESFVYEGEIYVLGIMKKYMTNPPYYAELGHSIPSGLSDELENKIKKCVKEAIVALQIEFGSINMDLLITSEGKVHIVDIGARMGGNLIGSHIIPLGTGIAYMENMIKAAVGDLPNFNTIAILQSVATKILSLTPGKIRDLPDFNEIAKEHNAIIEHHLFIDDVIREYHTNLDGCGYVVCLDDNVNKAEIRAEQVRKEIDKKIIRG